MVSHVVNWPVGTETTMRGASPVPCVNGIVATLAPNSVNQFAHAGGFFGISITTPIHIVNFVQHKPGVFVVPLAGHGLRLLGVIALQNAKGWANSTGQSGPSGQ